MPSLGHITQIIQRKTELKKIDEINIAQSYAKTLAIWRQNFLNRKDHILEMGFDEQFIRKWRYYLSFCEAAFKTNHLKCLQLCYEKGDK